ncbi:MAG: hypothetical protein KAY22_02270 [Rhizorhabdus sp.]|uniref:hypothetical protein n=1 Tax=Rhizorhabdus sp. TaxID=1968843 RepID=UPI001B76A128|nr:hypothetical protein [Rhizorhabdus sp.]MBP8231106.1 hypothetical protein [Rhizorhabdus sp.]
MTGRTGENLRPGGRTNTGGGATPKPNPAQGGAGAGGAGAGSQNAAPAPGDPAPGADARPRWTDGLDPRFDPAPSDNIERQLYNTRTTLLDLDARINGLLGERRDVTSKAREVERKVTDRRRKKTLESVEVVLAQLDLAPSQFLAIAAKDPRALERMKRAMFDPTEESEAAE